MRKLVFLFTMTFLLSGCTVAHFYYVRNLSESPVTIVLKFPKAPVTTPLPDSIYVSYSPTSHLVNKKTFTFMHDSIVLRRSNWTSMTLEIPAGAMLMWDKATSKKLGYNDPMTMDVRVGNKEPYPVYFGLSESNIKTFKKKGVLPKLFWFDIY